MLNTIIKKTLLHFDTRNNINNDVNSTPYNNCILKMRESYKLKSLSLKSCELILPSIISIPDDSITISVSFGYHTSYSWGVIPPNWNEGDLVPILPTLKNCPQYQIDYVFPDILTQQLSGTLTLSSLIDIINTVIEITPLTNEIINDLHSSNINFSLDSNNIVSFNHSYIGVTPKLIMTPLLKILGFQGDEEVISRRRSYHPNFTYGYFIYNGLTTASNFSQILFSPNYYALYFSNLPIKSNSSNGEPITFKIPATVTRKIPDLNLITVFYNEQSNYIQKVICLDTHFTFDRLNVYLYDNTNTIVRINTKINYSFSIEIEYETYF